MKHAWLRDSTKGSSHRHWKLGEIYSHKSQAIQQNAQRCVQHPDAAKDCAHHTSREHSIARQHSTAEALEPEYLSFELARHTRPLLLRTKGARIAGTLNLYPRFSRRHSETSWEQQCRPASRALHPRAPSRYPHRPPARVKLAKLSGKLPCNTCYRAVACYSWLEPCEIIAARSLPHLWSRLWRHRNQLFDYLLVAATAVREKSPLVHLGWCERRASSVWQCFVDDDRHFETPRETMFFKSAASSHRRSACIEAFQQKPFFGHQTNRPCALENIANWHSISIPSYGMSLPYCPAFCK